MSYTIEPLKREEIPVLISMIYELAEYEHLENEVVGKEEDFAYSLFEEKSAYALLAKLDGEPIGYAVYFKNFSTFFGRAGIYLEDLYIRPQYRGNGYGKELFSYVGRIAKENGYPRYEWSCLDWNEPSRQFYQSMGAIRMEDWTVHRLTGEPLDTL